MATPFSCKNAKVRSNAVAVTAKKWNVDMDGDPLEVSNFEAAGYSDTITGLLRCVVTVDLDLDGSAANKNPWDATGFNWTPGTDITNLTLYHNDTTGPSWVFPTARCIKSTNPADVKQQGMATFTFHNRGTFTKPSGAFVS
jgi:hypothetical protein